jgi:hypothetical protein
MLSFDWKGTILLMAGLVALLITSYFVGRLTAKPTSNATPIAMTGGSQATGWRLPENTSPAPAVPWNRQQYTASRAPTQESPSGHQRAPATMRMDPNWDYGDPARNQYDSPSTPSTPSTSLYQKPSHSSQYQVPAEPEFDENFTPL